MRSITVMLALLAGCSGNSFNQGTEPTGGSDSGDTTTDDTGDTTDDTGDTNSGDDSGDTDPVVEDCTNAWHPVHLSGWTKTFTATYEGASGTATEVGLGATTGPDGEYYYRYQDTISNTSGSGYDTTVTVACDLGADEGMFMLGWEGTYTYLLFEFIPMTDQVSATHSNPRRYFSPEWAVGSEGTWDYGYDLNIVQYAAGGKKPSYVLQQVSGTYADAGIADLELFDGTTVTAYKLTNNSLIVSKNKFGSTKQDIYIEQYWVKGLGLVKETFEDQTEGTILLSKELSAYTGLTPE
ncbi:MAG: hypothetical protein ACI8RZ_002967 [Myxococcota bacterium]|jgi:hypothetical protein